MRALIPGRFQPLHLGHCDLIRAAAGNEDVKELLIAICSAQYDHKNAMPGSRPVDNPFTCKERERMLKGYLKHNIKKKFRVFCVEDIPDDTQWVAHLKEQLPEFSIVYSGDKLVRGLIEKANIKVKSPEFRRNTHATRVRQLMVSNGNWKAHLPKESVVVIEEIAGCQRVKTLARRG
ncbi:hypothetical protein COT48_01490 [Candidatus Woesearchaeota archaeon CG08_land_8_20_14_0_20_47_9]|nr:MAG: hypothetical protein COT48_01490 [Candidatus Woesearchaeota archaeon CG08_land_8_20_14_0_20_47_9]HII30172.1 nicotinamide-nucleotide adenylyltransferase [Candidatus Woesearchaeota archaeon]